MSCEYISSYNVYHWHTILTYTHKHITWTRAYTNTRVPQLKVSQERSIIIKLVMQTHIVKPSPLHSENPGRCLRDTIARSSTNSNYFQRSKLNLKNYVLWALSHFIPPFTTWRWVLPKEPFSFNPKPGNPK